VVCFQRVSFTCHALAVVCTRLCTCFVHAIGTRGVGYISPAAFGRPAPDRDVCRGHVYFPKLSPKFIAKPIVCAHAVVVALDICSEPCSEQSPVLATRLRMTALSPDGDLYRGNKLV
jgi:hypothetical protein